ncbi:hypothetical protein BASA50_008267 [Batrachochytrium salamandrivorans]|uniref:Uncharacterized protein n=1 Tax=Batrachochytrium salamandrivorans TaxID=1357716 RepID=A0ABQ8F4N7_9FUNG|nr:hypothetical protein BASA60_007647 [Batrachochytrium salamandrivorans]KAH6576947.1 hypothetical protein BASA62_001125 [Batrachochytrium salamandrivorans]KAH6582498.1 hypothetical protein BASA61_008528 [Batrachochytrium salamandrivorans]KAH6592122.1 hypothetical protein BASA50_008267 [Batrachochytrium salamandrivorans]KAH9247081.1 hypothetical protein BASA81_015329 [Batrachochytrium salamandrivorans]
MRIPTQSADTTKATARVLAAAKLQAAMDSQFGHLFDDIAVSSQQPLQPTVNDDKKEDSNRRFPKKQTPDVSLAKSNSAATSSASRQKRMVEDMRSDDEDLEELDDILDNDQSDTDMDSLDDTPSDKESVPLDTGVSVVVFDDVQSKSGRSASSSLGNKSEWRAFMSSSIHKVAGRNLNKIKLTGKQVDEERENEENDKRLLDLLKTSKLIEQYTSSELTGKERINHHKAKIVELGGKAPKALKAPRSMRIGMAKKAEERASKRINDAKNTGMYHSTLKSQISNGGESQKSKKGPFKKRQDVGIIGSIGRIKDGVMHVAKKHIQAVEGVPKRSSGGGGGKRKGRGGAGNISIPGSSSVRGGGSKKKQKMTRLGM